VQRLRERGWIEDRTVTIEYRWSEGRAERYPEIAAEFVRLKVDVIVTTGGGVPAVKQATSAIPIVFPVAGDPVGGGFVATLARPGGNVTGLSLQQTDVASKRGGASARCGARSPAYGDPSQCRQCQRGARAGRDLGSSPHARPCGGPVGNPARRGHRVCVRDAQGSGGCHLCRGRPLVFSNRARIHTIAMAARLPAIYNSREYVEMGGLMSYGPNFPDMFRRAADMVDKILRGVKPGDLPVEQPTQFDLVINLTTAKALGLELPPTLLARADEVIE
jgi:putative tryptophan/tyrosine transport system substrate-binding protein